MSGGICPGGNVRIPSFYLLPCSDSNNCCWLPAAALVAMFATIAALQEHSSSTGCNIPASAKK